MTLCVINENSESIEIKNFILEIGIEELPARLLERISNHIKAELEKLLQLNELRFHSIENEYTPRRLFFAINFLEPRVSDKEIEIKGPPEKVAKSADGWTQAALGFAKKNNIKEEDLFIKEGYLCAKQFQAGIEARELLEQNLEQIIRSVPGERFMRTADGDFKFSRPLRWILSLLYDASLERKADLLKDDKGLFQVLNFSVENTVASNISYGHRFLAPEAFEVQTKTQYLHALKERGVYLSAADRKKKILEESKKLAKSVDAEVIIDEELLDEVAGLLENPTPILCSFNEQYLKIPSCVLTTVMAVHQRYFPLTAVNSEQGLEQKLLPYFIAVSNNPMPEAAANIRAGNEKVIIPRFKDAEFFFEEDNKTSLEEHLQKLQKLKFQTGNMLQKAERMQSLAKYLAEELAESYAKHPERVEAETLGAAVINKISEAAYLAKADLNTQMVFEFTELQGEIGGIYAAHQAKDALIADAIYDHYKPRFPADELPRSIAGKIVSIADKIDNLVCIFALGKIPKGSSDPFALRRQANALLEICIHGRLVLNLERLVDRACEIAEAQLGHGQVIEKTQGRGDKREVVKVPELDWSLGRSSVKDFLKHRLDFVFEVYHSNKEINTAVLASGNPLSQLNRKHQMLHFLAATQEDANYAKFIEAANRLMKICKSERAKAPEKELLAATKPNAAKFTSPEETNLHQAFETLGQSLKANAQEHYALSLKPSGLISLHEPINQFFENVLVNDENSEIKANRHALVAYGTSLLEEFADFTLL